MINSKDFTRRLEKIMSHYDLTATALAENIDFNRSAISHLISGRNKPSLEFVLKVLKMYDEVTWEWLLYGIGNFPSTLEDTNKTPESTKIDSGISAPDLFSQETEPFPSPKNQLKQPIERIVVFFTNGTFKNYEYH